MQVSIIKVICGSCGLRNTFNHKSYQTTFENIQLDHPLKQTGPFINQFVFLISFVCFIFKNMHIQDGT